jgi:hypothetical protein
VVDLQPSLSLFSAIIAPSFRKVLWPLALLTQCGWLAQRKILQTMVARIISCSRTCHMRATANISMDRKLLAEIDRWACRSGVSRSDLVCEFMRKQLAIMKLEALRARAMAEATARGLLTEEDMDAVLR